MQKKYLMGKISLFLWSVFGRTFLIQIFLCEDAIFFQSVHIASRKPLTPAHVQVCFFQFECGERGTGSMTEMVFRAPGWLTECEKVIQSPRHLSYGLGLGLRAASALISCVLNQTLVRSLMPLSLQTHCMLTMLCFHSSDPCVPDSRWCWMEHKPRPALFRAKPSVAHVCPRTARCKCSILRPSPFWPGIVH